VLAPALFVPLLPALAPDEALDVLAPLTGTRFKAVLMKSVAEL
jgi:hypothetical protein